MDPESMDRSERLLFVADRLLEQVAALAEGGLTMAGAKELSQILKNVKDIQTPRAGEERREVTVRLLGEAEDYGG